MGSTNVVIIDGVPHVSKGAPRQVSCGCCTAGCVCHWHAGFGTSKVNTCAYHAIVEHTRVTETQDVANARFISEVEKLEAWPDCIVKGCANKVCKWSKTNCCHPHAVEILGDEEMKRRMHLYNYGG